MNTGERRKRVAEEAAEWWVLLQGDATRAQREEYVEWLRESAVHVAEMLRMAQVHGALAQFERWTTVPTDGSEHRIDNVVPLGEAGRPSALERPKLSVRPLGFALGIATLLLLVVAALLQFPFHDQRIQTDRGERREVALADGSVVQIDPESSLRFDYGTDVRRVYLEHGRALFHVAKNPRRPFVVWADDTTVRAVGTSFAVEQGQGGVVVTVAEGKVAVLPARPGDIVQAQRGSDGSGASVEAPITVSPRAPLRPSGPAVAKNAAASAATEAATRDASQGRSGEIILTANEQITVAGSGTAERVREVDSQRVLAWAEGRLVFENDSVEYAVRQFNRYNRLRLTISDPSLARRTISGVFSASDPESFVAFIQSVAAVRVTRDDASGIAIDSAR